MNLLSSMESPMVSSELVFLKSGSDFVFTLRRLSQGSKCVERPLSRITVLLTQTLVGGCSFPRQVSPIITHLSGSFWAYGRPLSPMRWSKTWCASIRSLPIRSSMSSSGWSFGILWAISRRFWNCLATCGDGILSRLFGMLSHSMSSGRVRRNS